MDGISLFIIFSILFAFSYVTLYYTPHRFKGSKLFSEEDTCLFRTLLQGEFFISGFTNQQLRQHLSDKSTSQVTRLLKRLCAHGVIKKVGKRYKYYLTDFGHQTTAMALKLREMVVIPTFVIAAYSLG